MNNANVDTDIRPNPLSYLFGKTWLYSIGNRHNVVKFWTMFIIANSSELILAPLLLAKVIDTIQKDGITDTNILSICLNVSLLILFSILFWIFHGPARVIERLNAFKVRANYRKRLLKGVFGLPLDWHSDHHSGDIIDKVEKGSSALYDFSADSFMVIASVVQLIVSFCMLTYFSRSAAIIVTMMMSITIYIVIRIDRILIRQYIELNRAENRISENVYDSISNITTVIILRIEKLVFSAIAKKIDEPYDLFRRNNILNETKWFLTNLCCTLTFVIVLCTYFYQHRSTALGVQIGSVYILIKYLDKLSDLFFTFCYMYSDVVKRQSKVMNADELSVNFREESEVNHVLPQDWKQIKVSNLNFSYENAKGMEAHLENISIDMKRGERIALVGLSGSGKTTMLKVMRNLYKPTDLKLEVDGKLVDDGFGGIVNAIALVPQEPEIFATTILQNITLGAEYSPEKIRQFTDMACFTDVADALPKKLESSINERGVNFSGGQKQRLALTRGLLACEDKSLVLLDESTSSVDIVNDMRIYRNIFRSFPDKTIVSSIHKQHLLPLFDRIYVFDKGKIVGQGTFEELRGSCALLDELSKSDSEVYRDLKNITVNNS